MFLKTELLFVAVVMLFCGVTCADEKVVVAVIDSPIDLQSPKLSRVIDVGFLKQVRITRDDGVDSNAYDWNQATLDLYKSAIGSDRLKSVHSYLNLMVASELLYSQIQVGQELRRVKYSLQLIFSKQFKSDLDYFSNQLSHGTMVAGAVARVTDRVQILPIPLLTPFKGELERSDLKQIDEDRLRENWKRQISKVTGALRNSGAKIAVMSFGVSDEDYIELVNRMPVYSRVFLVGSIANYARRMAGVIRDAIEQLVLDNPGVLFVQAAGNSSHDLSAKAAAGSISTRSIKAPNLLRVSATTEHGAMSSFSNYSPEYVDLAARGEMLYLPLYGGHEGFTKGTSVAAPSVAGQLAEIFLSNPQFSVQEAVKYLYANHVDNDDLLRTYVKDGRRLNFCRQLLTRL